MLEIDGSIGEGGGSVLRISLALSTFLGEPIRVYNIRAKRSKPGLSNQHLSAVRALEKLSGAEVRGAELRSEEVFFDPEKVEGGSIGVDIGTAGSTTLILQSVMISAAFSKDPVDLEVIGGTDNPHAPPVDYLKNVTLPILRKLGYRGEVELVKRGHYPKGGGKIRAVIHPVEDLSSLKLTDLGNVDTVSGRSHCVKLPGHIAQRQAKSAEKRLEEAGLDAEIEVEFYEKSEDPHLSPGTGIVLWSESESGSILGSSAMGERGKPAEEVGGEAADSLIRQLSTGCAVDRYMTDQLIPYLAIADGKSEISSTELTLHTLTNVKIVEEILEADIEVEGGRGEAGRIFVNPSKKLL